MNICLQCGNETKNPKFCNNSCSAKYNNIGKTRRKVFKYCICGNLVKYKNQYCDNCIDNKIYNKKPIAELTSPKIIRERLIINRGNFCEACNRNRWLDNDIPLELHHVDGNYKNNDLSNLLLLCPNCHALTDNYKNRNKGSGREHRRKMRD